MCFNKKKLRKKFHFKSQNFNLLINIYHFQSQFHRNLHLYTSLPLSSSPPSLPVSLFHPLPLIHVYVLFSLSSSVFLSLLSLTLLLASLSPLNAPPSSLSPLFLLPSLLPLTSLPHLSLLCFIYHYSFPLPLSLPPLSPLFLQLSLLPHTALPPLSLLCFIYHPSLPLTLTHSPLSSFTSISSLFLLPFSPSSFCSLPLPSSPFLPLLLQGDFRSHFPTFLTPTTGPPPPPH